MSPRFSLCCALLLAFVACDAPPEPPTAAPATPGLSTPPAARPAQAAHAQMVQKQEEGDIAGLSFPADQIARHGRLLLSMTTELPGDARADLLRASATFDTLAQQMAQAASRGDAARTAALLEQYRLPLAALDRHSP
jgi:hypothetical protein